MTATDDLTATLDQIKGRGYHNGARGALCARLSDAAAVDVPRLLAAIEAVLKLADEAEPVDHDYGGEPIWWSLMPAEVREAITRELAKGEPPDGS